MPNRFARLYLAIAGLVFIATGATFVLAPTLAPSLASHPAPTADAINDVRAIYGAMELAYGVFLATCSTRPRLYEAGLLAAIFLGGFSGMCRFVGVALLPDTPSSHLAYGLFDLVGALIGWIGLRRLAREARK